jgi:DNA-directed RNA polymerase specialized sigma24 family protein
MTDPTPPDVHAALEGDAAAFGRLLEQQHRALWAIALAILADPHAAEEVIQEAALAAWRSRAQLQDPART